MLSSESILFASAQQLGCCINDQTGFPITNADLTCNNVLQSQCPGGSTFVAGVSCYQVPECGCCVANPSSQNPQFYTGSTRGDVITTQNFCNSFFPNTPTIILTGKTTAQCLALQGTGPVNGTPISPQPSSSTGNITGNIKSGGVNIPGLNVKVTLSTNLVNTFSTTTNAQGNFEFRIIPLGNYQISAQGCGFNELTQTISNPQTNTYNLNILRAQTEKVVIDTLDTNNNLISGVTFSVLPQINTKVQDSLNGKSIIDSIDSNCIYNLTATYNGVIQTKTLTLSSNDGITLNPLKFNFPATSDQCKSTTDCRGPDGVLGSGVDCTHFCQSNEVCDGGNGTCVPSTQKNCCSYEFQCSKTQTVQNSNSCAPNQVECQQSCSSLPQCPDNTQLSVGSAGSICSCTTPVLIQKGIQQPYPSGEGKFCCSGVLSDNKCDYKTQARVYGQVTGNLGPLVAEIIIDKGTQNEKRAYTDTSGNYEIFLSPNVQHNLEYRKGKSYDPQTKTIQKSAGSEEKIDIVLTSSGGKCDSPNSPPVIDFFAENVRGKSSALLKWTPPSCGSLLFGSSSTKPQTYIISEPSLGNFTIDSSKNEFLIENLDWDKSYTFSIVAVYSDRADLRYSSPVYLFQPFDPGVKECSGRTSSDEFCLEITKRRFCDSQNQISSAVDKRDYNTDDCSVYNSQQSSISGGEWYCSYEIDNNNKYSGKTKCLQQSESLCGYQYANNKNLPVNIPFLGLLFNKDTCSYDSSRNQYSKGCYLDKSETTVNFCFSCPRPGDPKFSCALYQSKNACEGPSGNICGIPSECVWEDNKFGSLGEGRCYAKETLSDKKNVQIEKLGISKLYTQSSCSLCSTSSGLFNNVDCTQNICSSLGLCYETTSSINVGPNPISSCSQCLVNNNTGELLTSCNDFKNMNSCVNSTGRFQAFVSSQGNLISSDDACGIGKCVWDNVKNLCFKDGNLDNIPDCTSSTGVLNPQCVKDYTSPETSPLFSNVILNRDPNSLSNNLNFSLSESIKEFNFCMYKSGSPQCNTFQNIPGVSGSSSNNKIILNFNPLSYFYNLVNDSGVYILRFYSEDYSSNLEQIKEVPLVFDSESPQISFGSKVECNNCDAQVDCSKGESYHSNVEFNILSDEPVSCSDYLIPPGFSKFTTPFTKKFQISSNGNEIHEFGTQNHLLDGTYRYFIECFDRAGNSVVKEDLINVDSSKLISSVSPRGSLSNPNIFYNVKTSSTSSCDLSIDGNQAIKLSSSNLVDHTKNLTYAQDKYHYYVVWCKENNPISNSRCDISLQEFIVDTSAPLTTAKISSRTFSSSKWILSSSTPTELILTPEDIGANGLSFGVNYTKLCTTSGNTCNPDTAYNAGVYPHKNSKDIRIRASTNLGVCYYSVDNGGNKETTKCGKVNLVPPPEITITSPAQNTVTNQPSINLKGTHKVTNVASASIVISNKTSEKIILIHSNTLASPSFDILIDLLSGENTISLRIVDGNNIETEDIITVYKDLVGPDVSSLTSQTADYGKNITLSSLLADKEWTAITTGDNIGEINSASATLKSIPLNFTRTFALTKNIGRVAIGSGPGEVWSSTFTPVLSGKFYDVLPGTYDLILFGEDKFGNNKSIKTNITIIKSTPTNIKVNVSNVNYREKDTFYINSQSPNISVFTEEPSQCTLLLSQTPRIEQNLNSTDNYNHTLTSSILFNQGSKQTFSSLVSCRDTLSNLEKTYPIEIIYDDVSPEIILSSLYGKLEIEKKDKVYELVSDSSQIPSMQFKNTNLIARDLGGDYIKCSFSCTKQGAPNSQSCGLIHSTIIPKFGSDDYFLSQSQNIDYSLEQDPYGVYVYQLICSDKSGNKANPENIVMYVKPNKYYSLSSTQSQPINSITTITQTPDLEIPVITNVDVLTSLGERGIIEKEQRDQFKKLILVGGQSNNQFTFKLIVDAQESVDCRYGTTRSPFSNLPYPMIRNVYYTESQNITLADKTSTKYYVVCMDDSRKESLPYEIDIEANSLSPIVIEDASPQGTISASGIIVSAFTQRDLDCTYDDGRHPRLDLVKTLTDNGYLHQSSTKPGQTLFLPQNTQQTFKITCSGNGLSSTEIINFTLDNTPPLLTITSPPTNNQISQTSNSYVDLEGVTEPNTKLNFYINGFFHNNIISPSGNNTVQFSSRIYLSNNGRNILRVEAEDSAVNVQSREIQVDTSSTSPKVLSLYPYMDKLPSLDKISAKLSSDTSSVEVNVWQEVNNSKIIVNGNSQYNPQTHELIFTPSSNFVQGSYSYEVIPRGPSGNLGFGSYGRFEISDQGPYVRWTSPSLLSNSLTNSITGKNRIEISSNSQNRDRLITKAKIFTGTSLDNLKEYDVERIANSYMSTSELPQGKQYVKIILSDIGGSTESVKIVDVDTQGPSSTFTPSGTLTTTRPVLRASFGEQVKLRSFSLENINTKEPQTLLLNVVGSQTNAGTSSTQSTSSTPSGVQSDIFEFSPGAQLLQGSYILSIETEDINGNVKISTHTFTISVGNSISLKLVNPENGVSPTNIFDLTFETNQDAECRYSNLDVGSNFNSHSGTFSTTGNSLHIIKGFSDIKVSPPQTQSLYVICKSPFSTTTPSIKYELSIDSVAPKIENIQALPKVITERPLSTQIIVDTDKETLCKFDCIGNTDYDSMQNSMGSIFTKSHLSNFAVKDMTKYECSVSCKSKSGLLTPTENLKFEADTSILPPFEIVSPSEGSAFANKTIPLHITSQRLARCSYNIDNSSVILFPLIAREFKGEISNLSMSNHSLEVECLFSSGSEKKSSNFVIDLTPPSNVTITHPGSVCTNSVLNVEFNSQDRESGISGYVYSVKESSGSNIINETFTSSNKISKLSQLVSGKNYVFTVRARNGAGLETSGIDSSQLSISNSSAQCYDKIAPSVTLLKNETKGKTIVEIKCSDSGSGCSSNKKYGISPTSSGCNSTSPYISPLTLSETNYVCYEFRDNAGNIASNIEKVEVNGKIEPVASFKVNLDVKRENNLSIVTLNCVNSNCTSLKYGVADDFSACVPDKEYTIGSSIEIRKDGTYVCYLGIDSLGNKVESAQKIPVRQSVSPSGGFKWIYLAIGIFVLILLIVGGYFGYNYYSGNVSTSNEFNNKSGKTSLPERLSLNGGSKSNVKSPGQISKQNVQSTDTSSSENLRAQKLKERNKVREVLFDEFISQKEKITPSPSTIPPNTQTKTLSKDNSQPSTRKKDNVIGFDKLDELISSSKKFDKLITRLEKPLKKDEFTELQKLSSSKGVKITKDEFDNLMKLVNEKIKRKSR